jgi:hypothetical protein
MLTLWWMSSLINYSHQHIPLPGCAASAGLEIGRKTGDRQYQILCDISTTSRDVPLFSFSTTVMIKLQRVSQEIS